MVTANSKSKVKDIFIPKVDFVTAVCPCAGLSSANSSNRGHDAPQNDWMYKTAEFVLEHGFLDKIIPRTELKTKLGVLLKMFKN